MEVFTLAWDVFFEPLCRSYFQCPKRFDFSCFLAESVSDCVGPYTPCASSRAYIFRTENWSKFLPVSIPSVSSSPRNAARQCHALVRLSWNLHPHHCHSWKAIDARKSFWSQKKWDEFLNFAVSLGLLFEVSRNSLILTGSVCMFTIIGNYLWGLKT
jgi:hypothetical protein